MRDRSLVRSLTIPAAVVAAATLAACESVIVAMVDVEVEVVPETVTLVEGETADVSAVVRERGGGELHDAEVTWTVEQPRIASVDSDGTVAGHERGTTRLVASSAGVSGVASITVVRRGGRGGGDGGDDDDDCDGVIVFGVCID